MSSVFMEKVAGLHRLVIYAIMEKSGTRCIIINPPKANTLYKAALCATILYGVGSLLYCILCGQSMMVTHIDPHYAWRNIQTALAMLLSLVLFFRKETRKQHYWQVIPCLLLGLAPVYVLIVDQFPCCVGG